jgi:hypothetical protein
MCQWRTLHERGVSSAQRAFQEDRHTVARPRVRSRESAPKKTSRLRSKPHQQNHVRKAEDRTAISPGAALAGGLVLRGSQRLAVDGTIGARANANRRFPSVALRGDASAHSATNGVSHAKATKNAAHFKHLHIDRSVLASGESVLLGHTMHAAEPTVSL